MCGICGILSKRSDRPVDPDLIQRMNNVLRHRGPDDAGVWANAPRPHLAMRRLAIIDLVTGHQPMANEDGTVHVVFNGEIYNFRELRATLQARGHTFATASDTEVIVHAYEEYGVECVRHLDGMFGIALWDERRERLLLARDPFGIKPLYWTDTGERILWGSEIKALLQDKSVRREVDRESLHHYLTYLYVPSPRTMFAGIHKLPPGHRLVWERGALTIEEYWAGPEAYLNPDSAARKSEIRDPKSEILKVLGDAVESQMVSDVPLGAFLSGGIDSTAIVALMSERSTRPVQTFSIGFRNAGLYDELQWARIIAERFHTDHHEFEVDPDTAELVPRLTWHLDEPLADASIIPNYLVAKMARQFVTVALTGIGGDELFGGYRRYYADGLARRWQQNPLLRLTRRGLIDPLLGHLPSGGHTRLHNTVRLARKLFDHMDLAPEHRYVAWNSSYTEEMKGALYAPGFRGEGWEPSHALAMPLFQRVGHLPFAERAMYVDMKTYLSEDPLMMADKMTMANSLESRVPFLDPRVVEFAAGLPLSEKVRGQETKYLLRQSLRGRAPDALLDRPKQGFGTPIDLWLRRELRGLVGQILAPEVVAARGYFRPEAVQDLLREHQGGRNDVSQHIWALLIFELWHRMYIDRDYSDRPDLTFADLDLGSPASGGVGEWESGRVGERESVRVGESGNGRVGETAGAPAPSAQGRPPDGGTPAGWESGGDGATPTLPLSHSPIPPLSHSPEPLSIVMVSDVDPALVIGGAERILAEHSRRLAARGHRVTVLTRREDPERPAYEVIEGVAVHRHPVSQGNPLAFMRSVLREGGREFAKIAEGTPVDVLNIHQPLAGYGIIRSGEGCAPHRVYTFLSPWAAEYRTRAGMRSGEARVSPAQHLSRHVNAVVRQRMEKACLDSCQAIHVLSGFSAAQLGEAHGIGGDRVSVIPGGVDTDHFRPVSDRDALKRELGLPPRRPVLFTVRNLVARMGLDNLLEAMARVHRECPEATLVIGGKGPLMEPLRAQTVALGLTDCVSFAGFIPEEKLPAYYAAADLFVLPTVALEGFGLVTVEAMACGTPALGTPVGGTQEILHAFDPAFLFRSPAPEHLAEGILGRLPQVRGNEALRLQCRRHVEEKYSWDVIIPRLEALFYTTAGKWNPEPPR